MMRTRTKSASSRSILSAQKGGVKKTTTKTSPSTLNTASKERLDVYVFGSGNMCELGLGHMKRDGKVPQNVKRPRRNDLLDAEKVGVVQVAVGGMHSMALTHDNQVLTWGVNDSSALGRDTKYTVPEDYDSDDEDDTGLNPLESTPSKVDLPENLVITQVAAADNASFVLTSEGNVYGWGSFRGSDGIIGFSGTRYEINEIQKTPKQYEMLENIVKLSAGGNHVLALDSKGSVFSWGNGSQNQLGRDIMEIYKTLALQPARCRTPRDKIVEVSAGAYHNFAIDNRGNVYAWGLNNFGQCGFSDNAGEDNAIIKKPKIVKSLAEYKIKHISCGTHHSVACTEDGDVLVWGRCDDGQVGIALDKLPKDDLIFNERGKARILSKPTIIPGLKAVSVAAGIDICITLTQTGEAYSWGFSENWRTGQGTDETISEPMLIDNSAVKGKKLTFAGCGAQFSVLAGPAGLPVGEEMDFPVREKGGRRKAKN